MRDGPERAVMARAVAARRHGADRGSASVVVLAIAMVVALLGGATVTVAAGADAAVRAQAAADLGALAAAREARDARAVADPGGGASCAVAQRVVERNGARMLSCSVERSAVVSLVAAAPVAGGTVMREWRVVRSAAAGPLGARKSPGSGSN